MIDLAVDPGQTAGIAWLDEESLAFGHAELGWREALDCCVTLELSAGVRLLVVERYVLSPASLRMSREGLAAVEMLGALRYLLAPRVAEWAEQTAAEAMRFATNDKLRAAGMYVRGREHARDAARHLLTALVVRGRVRPEDLVQSERSEEGGE